MVIRKETISVRYWHDLHPDRKRKDGTYPVKIIVYSERQKKNKKYKTPFYLTEKDFESAYLTSKPRKDWKPLRDKLEIHRIQIVDIAGSIHPFTFELFEKRMGKESRKLTASGISDYLTKELDRTFRPDHIKGASRSPVIKGYDDYIDTLRSSDQFRTANNYLHSLKSIYGYFLKRQKAGTPFDFDTITADFLKSYQRSMEADGYSLSSVSMYARALRTIYLRAIKAGIAEMKLYPFGMEKEGKYDPPNVRRVNHPLLKDEIQMLIDAKPESYDQMKARDYFLFAYYGGGMNMADILRLKWGDLTADTISFYRKKTKSTRQANLMPVSIPLNDITSAIIQRHGNDRKGADDYIFPVLNRLDEYAGKGKMKGDWREALIKNHTRYVNQHIKKLAKAIGIRIEIFSQRARYSFADHTRNADIPIDVRMSMMGQDNEKTHRIYLSTIPDAMTREAVNQALVSPKKKGNGKD